MALVNVSTFAPTATVDAGSLGNAIVGIVEVTLRGKTQRVEARRYEQDGEGGNLYVRGLTGRYETGAKAWPASITVYPEGREVVWFGRDDRSGRFNKANGLFFA